MAPTLHTNKPAQKPPFIPPPQHKTLLTSHKTIKHIQSLMASLPALLSPPQFNPRTLSLLLLLSLLSLSHPLSIHDLLRSHGLPPGLFPDNVKSYDMDQNGRLEVVMQQPCTAKFEARVFFDSVVRANLSYGGLTGLEGLSQEELFLWLPVKGIIVYDQDSGLILFDIGYAHKELSLSLFEDPPICQPQGVLLEDLERKKLALQVQR